MLAACHLLASQHAAWPGWPLVIVVTMDDEESAADLKRQQAAKERVEREDAAKSDEDAEAAAHLRRAEKAEYLREKLSQREAADASRDDRPSEGRR